MSLIIGPRFSNVKSWPGNHLQVWNLTFDPCFKVNLGHHASKRRYISLINGSRPI